MGAEEISHSAVGLESVAKGGDRREPIEEGEERDRGEREGVMVNEVDEMVGFEGREEPPKRRGERLCFDVVDGCGDGGEYRIACRRRRQWGVPCGVAEGRFGGEGIGEIGEFECGIGGHGCDSMRPASAIRGRT